MKIKFGHLSLAYPAPERVALEFIAETEFERDWLKSLARLNESLSFEYKYPNEEPKDLNNPLITLVLKTGTGK
jgi:hypothetical protein